MSYHSHRHLDVLASPPLGFATAADNLCPATAPASDTTPSAPKSATGTGIGVTCATGYSTSATATCHPDNSWSLPACTNDPCPAMAAASGTQPSVPESATGPRYAVTCATGYSTAETATCNPDNSWSLPACTDDPCPATTTASGTTPFAPESATGSGLAVTCATGYSTSDTATCGADNTWILPTCTGVIL